MKKKINNLLHRARRQAVVDTEYLLRWRRRNRSKETEKKKKNEENVGDKGCAFAQLSHTV